MMNAERIQGLVENCFDTHEWTLLVTNDAFMRGLKAVRRLEDFEPVVMLGHSMLISGRCQRNCMRTGAVADATAPE
jgi:hypothetical protein